MGLDPPWLTVTDKTRICHIESVLRVVLEKSLMKPDLYNQIKRRYSGVICPMRSRKQNWFSTAPLLVDHTNHLSGTVVQKMLVARVGMLWTEHGNFLLLPRSCWS